MPTEAGMFASLAPHLASRYTTVAYDLRGSSRSVFDDAAAPIAAAAG